MSSYYNLEDIAKEYCQTFLDSSQKKDADLKRPIFNWDAMFVVYGDTYYKERTPALPTHDTLFQSTFVNQTPKSQIFSLKTERRTRSTCSMTLTRTFSYGGKVSVKLGPPGGFVEANVGFHMDISNVKGVSHVFEQELKWSIDTNVEVPPQHQAHAKLVIRQDHFDGIFTATCVFYGSVMVTYETKKNRDLVSVISCTVSDMLSGKAGFNFDSNGRPNFIVEGTCQCRFGVDQKVVLTQEAI